MGFISHNPTLADAVGLAGGICTETSLLTATTYLHQDQWEAFNVKGRIHLRMLFMEVYSALGNVATTIQFNYTFTTPVLAVKPLCAASGAMNSAPRGYRAQWIGGAVASNPVVTVATGLCSDVTQNASGAILGGKDAVGTIGFVTAGADATQGSVYIAAVWAPIGTGSLEANI